MPKHSVVVTERGNCTFVEKLELAARAGAARVIVVNQDDEPLNPSSDPDELDRVEEDMSLDEYALVVVTFACPY